MIINTNNLDWLKKQEDNSIDHIISDPPYLINFMGKGWDSEDNIAGNPEFWKECLRVVKPGGYCLAFGHSRTHHRVMSAIEDAGWEIRDCLMWLTGQGFPKSQNLGKKAGEEWEGWGSALKPAYEPIIMARKPFKGSLINNVLEWETGALNIDACRIGQEEITINKLEQWSGFGQKVKPDYESTKQVGRFPANVILTHSAGCKQVGTQEEELLLNGKGNKFVDILPHGQRDGKAVKGVFKKSKAINEVWECEEGCPVKELDNQSGITKSSSHSFSKDDYEHKDTAVPFKRGNFQGKGDVGGASRFFYCAKVGKKERNLGCEDLESQKVNDGRKTEIDNPYQRGETLRKNTHPTVKPIALMEWLIKLVSKEGQTILDPFMGSGSTGCAAQKLNRNFIGLELNKEYCEIAEKRIKYFEDNKE